MTQRKWLAECHAWLDDPTSVQYELEGVLDWWTPSASGFNPIRNPEHRWHRVDQACAPQFL